MARRNADQLDLMSYRPPRPARRKRRKLAAVKVKFGPSSVKDVPKGDDYDFPLLARRGSGPWVNVGEVVAQVTDVDQSILEPRYMVLGYHGSFWSDLYEQVEDAGREPEYEADILAPPRTYVGRRPRNRNAFMTSPEAKNAVKEWAAETLEAVGWEG